VQDKQGEAKNDPSQNISVEGLVRNRGHRSLTVLITQRLFKIPWNFLTELK